MRQVLLFATVRAYARYRRFFRKHYFIDWTTHDWERAELLKGIVSWLVLILLLVFSLLALASNVPVVRAKPTIITVPDDYPTIQKAIDAANEGATIFVRNGTYSENVVLNKPNLTLIGEDKHTTVIDGNGESVVSLEVNNTKIKGFTLQNGDCGILMSPWTHEHAISNNIIENNDYGVSGHYDCFDVSICDNTISSNNISGIQMLFSHSMISNNLISDNGKGEFQGYSSGIQIVMGVNSEVVYCVNNIVFGNTIKNHQIGIWAIRYSEENLFFHNNLVNNTIQFSGRTTMWNNSIIENYWSEYSGVDMCSGPYQNETGSDGIGDTPYEVDVNNQDEYPLMGMFSDFNVTSEYHVQTVCNSTISGLICNGTAISFNVFGENDTAGFCRMCIPKSLMNETYRVFVNGTEVKCTLLTEISNITHSYIYFIYNHSVQEVVVIPEFPSLPILPLFMIAKLLAVIICKRKDSV